MPRWLIKQLWRNSKNVIPRSLTLSSARTYKEEAHEGCSSENRLAGQLKANDPSLFSACSNQRGARYSRVNGSLPTCRVPEQSDSCANVSDLRASSSEPSLFLASPADVTWWRHPRHHRRLVPTLDDLTNPLPPSPVECLCPTRPAWMTPALHRCDRRGRKGGRRSVTRVCPYLVWASPRHRDIVR